MKKKLSVFYILLAGGFWGSSCLFLDYLTEAGFSPMQCTAIRITFAALILNCIVIIKGRGFKLYKTDLLSLAMASASGLFSVLAMCVCYYYCILRTSAAVGAILLYTAPIFVMIMSLIFFKEKLTAKKILAFFIAIIGCALVSGIASGVSGDPLGILFGVLSGLAYSLYGIFASVFMKRNSDPAVFSALNFAFAAVGSLILAHPDEIVTISASYDNIALLVGVMILFSVTNAVFPFLLYTTGLTGVKPDVASILAFSEPLTAAVLGITVLRQPFDAWQIIGILLVTSAIVILNLNINIKMKR